MEITGLPLHPLVVHATVALVPLACAASMAYAAVPRWRDWLRWPVAVAVVVTVAVIWAAHLTGDDLFASERYASLPDDAQRDLERHQELADLLRLVGTGFAAVTLGAVGLHRRSAALRPLLLGLVAAGAVATLVLTVLTGDAGARSVWG